MTLQALWMGAPVVTLLGQNFASSMGASFMRTLGQPGWVAEDDAGYVAAAVALAHEYIHVRGQRHQMRAQMAASPLCDISGYVANFDSLLKQMWVTHCAGKKPPVIGLNLTGLDS